MGANRAQRRKQQREQIREWRHKDDFAKSMVIMQQGLSQKDLDEAYNNGYQEGYMKHAEEFMRKMYAACAKEMLSAGNDREDVVNFIRNVDHRFSVIYDADDEIDDVYQEIGVYLNVDRNAINHVERGAVANE